MEKRILVIGAQKVSDAFLKEWETRSREPDAIFFGTPVMEIVGRRSK